MYVFEENGLFILQNMIKLGFKSGIESVILAMHLKPDRAGFFHLRPTKKIG